MADSGISSVVNSLGGTAATGRTSATNLNPPLILTPAANSIRPVSAKQSQPSQLVKSGGQVYDKSAPRGSYVNLVI